MICFEPLKRFRHTAGSSKFLTALLLVHLQLLSAPILPALMPNPCSFVAAFLTVLSSLAVMPVRCQRGEGQLNVYGRALALCSRDPMTGWYRDGYARTDQFDHGSHVGETPHFLFFKTVTYILHTLHSGFFYKNTPNQLSLSTFSNVFLIYSLKFWEFEPLFL